LFDEAHRFNCHLSVRQPGREFLYKPNNKVSTAAACDAVLISTRDQSAIELLGEDYPYYCEPDRESVLAAIERARQSLGSATWNAALERVRAVRALTHTDRVLDQYESLLREVAEPLLRGREPKADPANDLGAPTTARR
jgi:hypothetical protein